jgi:hypothetical protein
MSAMQVGWSPFHENVLASCCSGNERVVVLWDLQRVGAPQVGGRYCCCRRPFICGACLTLLLVLPLGGAGWLFAAAAICPAAVVLLLFLLLWPGRVPPSEPTTHSCHSCPVRPCADGSEDSTRAAAAAAATPVSSISVPRRSYRQTGVHNSNSASVGAGLDCCGCQEVLALRPASHHPRWG